MTGSVEEGLASTAQQSRTATATADPTTHVERAASRGDAETGARPQGTPWHSSRWVITCVQAAFVGLFLLAWEYLPQIPGVSASSHFLDPFFISSPSKVYEQLVRMVTGRDGGPLVWPLLWPTFGASILGTVLGLVLGGVVGLLLGSFRFLGRVFRPFVVTFNAIPRIALVPLIVVVMGSGLASSTVIAVLVVFFVALFQAEEGAHTVERHVLENVRLFGASGWDLMWRVRSRYALAWTLASLPVAVSFAIVSVVAAEILIGGNGLGGLMSIAALQANADLTFGVIVFLAVFALILLGASELFKRRVLRWWLTDSGV